MPQRHQSSPPLCPAASPPSSTRAGVSTPPNSIPSKPGPPWNSGSAVRTRLTTFPCTSTRARRAPPSPSTGTTSRSACPIYTATDASTRWTTISTKTNGDMNLRFPGLGLSWRSGWSGRRENWARRCGRRSFCRIWRGIFSRRGMLLCPGIMSRGIARWMGLARGWNMCWWWRIRRCRRSERGRLGGCSLCRPSGCVRRNWTRRSTGTDGGCWSCCGRVKVPAVRTGSCSKWVPEWSLYREWWIDWSIDWSIDWLDFQQSSFCAINCPNGRFIQSIGLTSPLIDWLVWLIDWFYLWHWLLHWSADRLIDRFIYCTDPSIDWLMTWLAGWTVVDGLIFFKDCILNHHKTKPVAKTSVWFIEWSMTVHLLKSKLAEMIWFIQFRDSSVDWLIDWSIDWSIDLYDLYINRMIEFVVKFHFLKSPQRLIICTIDQLNHHNWYINFWNLKVARVHLKFESSL